jgi:hypothetical protein
MLLPVSADEVRRAPQVGMNAAERTAVLEILRDTKPDFPR